MYLYTKKSKGCVVLNIIQRLDKDMFAEFVEHVALNHFVIRLWVFLTYDSLNFVRGRGFSYNTSPE